MAGWDNPTHTARFQDSFFGRMKQHQLPKQTWCLTCAHTPFFVLQYMTYNHTRPPTGLDEYQPLHMMSIIHST